MYFNIKKANYVIVPKNYLKSKCLTLKAKGLLSIMFSLPEEWNYTIKGLCTITNCGETQIKAIIKELKAAGFIEVIKYQDELGRYKYRYDVYHEPIKTDYNVADFI